MINKRKELLNKIIEKQKFRMHSVDNKIPYMAVNGEYRYNVSLEPHWWTNGFWGGINWKLYEYTKDDTFKKEALRTEDFLEENLVDFVTMHHDVGFLWLPTSGYHYLDDQNSDSYRRLLHAATILAGRFNIKGNFIRCWNDEQMGKNTSGVVIIDSMMNVSLLFLASEFLKDPRFKHMAIAHAKTIAENLVREDGSVQHMAEFNSESGKMERYLTGQGFSENSAWSRGVSWALYGFTNCYKHTKNQIFLDVALKIVRYLKVELPKTNYIARIDYKAPAILHDTDASASAIAYSGLIDLEKIIPIKERKIVSDLIEELESALISLADVSKETDGVINNCAVQYHMNHQDNISLNYADYYFIEGLMKREQYNINIW